MKTHCDLVLEDVLNKYLNTNQGKYRENANVSLEKTGKFEKTQENSGRMGLLSTKKNRISQENEDFGGESIKITKKHGENLDLDRAKYESDMAICKFWKVFL